MLVATVDAAAPAHALALHVAAAALLDEGVFVTGFSYPVVPMGKARIRTQLSAGHSAEHIDRAIAAFTRVGQRLGVV